MIDFSAIEKKWQKKWASEKVFEASDKGKKYYSLEQYPYPSGSGLHVGHSFIYTIGDIHARLKRMQGFNVLHPIGFDSFGLPAENAAIKAKSHPKKFTDEAIKSFVEEMKLFGFSYDWSRVVMSHDSDYYKWDQWIFLKMLEKGLAYRKKASVNWCPKCNTVLANEQVNSGKCWRHEDTDVEVKQLEQWFLKITDYAEELYDNLDKLEWPETIKKLQKNWIGKSEGAEVVFKVGDKDWKVFTTRPDTIFGVTFLVVSAQHSDLMELVASDRKKEVEKFLKKMRSVSEEDLADMEKEGVFTGSYAIHPLSGEKIPIWAGNFVLADYGSGMVMGVPAHDQRDFDFAKKYGLDVKQVVSLDGKESKMKEAMTDYGTLINSEGFDGLKSREAIEHITNALEMKGLGGKKTAYRLRDWLVSRQRFWGTPIPIIYCDDCGAVPVPEKDLPVVLPENLKFESVENPLKTSEKFWKVKCPCCGKNARRETDTMDTFVNSSWYFLRFCDPHNSKKIFDKKKADYWMPIDMYVGGMEHACLHDIYFRFYTKFLRDIGLVSVDEPALKLFNQGFIHGADGRKMSKSYGNVVLLGEAARKYGVDATRLFLVSVASPDKDFNWSDEGAEGSLRFVLRVFDFASKFKESKMNALNQSKFNRLIKEYTSDIEEFRYNLAVIKLREIFFILEEGCSNKQFGGFLKLMSPICPHVSEELWSKLGNKGFVCIEKWPAYDSKKINPELEEKEKQVEKTVEDILNILKIIKERGKEAERVYVYVIPKEIEFYDSEKLSARIGKKVMVYAVNDSKKYDPEGKASKARFGKPGIYVE